MKIATWNVNSLTARLQHVLDWLAVNPVDVLALQELKLTDDKFPHEALRAAGYEAAVFGQKTYNGVALLTRAPLQASDVARNIAGLADDNARLIAATLDAPGGPLRLVNGYFVNGQAPGTDKFDYKMSWLRALREHLRASQDDGSHHRRRIGLRLAMRHPALADENINSRAGNDSRAKHGVQRRHVAERQKP